MDSVSYDTWPRWVIVLSGPVESDLGNTEKKNAWWKQLAAGLDFWPGVFFCFVLLAGYQSVE